jgi:hypothetical protein
LCTEDADGEIKYMRMIMNLLKVKLMINEVRRKIYRRAVSINKYGMRKIKVKLC